MMLKTLQNSPQYALKRALTFIISYDYSCPQNNAPTNVYKFWLFYITIKDYLSFLINRLNSFLSYIMCLILIFRSYFLRYSIKFIQTFLTFYAFFVFLIHSNHHTFFNLCKFAQNLRLWSLHNIHLKI